jgi:hypothetical protein
MLLTACAGTPRVASVQGGEKHALTGPEYAIKGATQYDQNWIDETTEAGVSALGWKRPKPRPPHFDAKPIPVKAAPPPITPNAQVSRRFPWWWSL